MPREELLRKIGEILKQPDLSQKYCRGPIHNPPPRLYCPHLSFYLANLRVTGIIKD